MFFKLQLTLVVDYLNYSYDFYGPAEIYFSPCFHFFESHGKIFPKRAMKFIKPQQTENQCPDGVFVSVRWGITAGQEWSVHRE